jgi:transglutaminase-like putative cysteine protease
MDEAAATAPADALDVLAAFDVPIEGLEGSTWDLGHLELEWRGSDVLLPEREFQHARWERQNELQIVVFDYAPPPSEAELEQRVPEAVAVELAPDPLCESDHPRMRQLAAEVVAGRENPWDKVVAIVHWVNANIVSSLSSNRTTALGVLEARAGDCSESTLLACALLRASGVPARRVEGVAYVGPSERILGCHAWLEVWIGRWIPVDPTWAQAPADVTHVCFGGERDSRIANSGAMHARATKVVRR